MAKAHRVIASKKIGRPIHPGEVVHHRNGVHGDNREGNLLVMSKGVHDQMEGAKKSSEWYKNSKKMGLDANAVPPYRK